MKSKIDYIFEISWEVCNKVGGIYTVLSSRALTMKNYFDDNIIFVGADLRQDVNSVDFVPTNEFSDWRQYFFKTTGLSVKIGRWQIPGKPAAVLVDFKPLYDKKNQIYGNFWVRFGVNSLNAYGDYDESSMFGYAAGMVVESFVEFYKLQNKRIAAHFNEWMTAFGLLYLKAFCPNIKTLFTTHATTVGRSIASNGKPLYDCLNVYNGDQMARELNVEAKHSAEKAAAHFADCFTTVSNITAKECECLLGKKPDIVTPNGFENDFIPKYAEYGKKRKTARKLLLNLAEKVLGYKLSDDYVLIGISGRYEYKNKGIDVFIDTMNKINKTEKISKKIIAFIIVPAWVKENCYTNSKFAASTLMQENNDLTLNYIRQNNFTNNYQDNVKIIFIPTYLNGNDGRLNVPYYDILVGLDLTVFPSYYEPWGYTPMESAAFGIPTVTTSLAGFGQWVSSKQASIENGIAVIDRNDHNYFDVVENIVNETVTFISSSLSIKKQIGKKAREIAQKALWSKFFDYYLKAYQIAFKNK